MGENLYSKNSLSFSLSLSSRTLLEVFILLFLLKLFIYYSIYYLYLPIYLLFICFVFILISREEIMQRDGNFSVELGEKFREREDNLPFLRFISFSRLVFLIRSYKNIYNIII